MRRMKIVNLVADSYQEFNSSHFRGVIPTRALRQAGHDARLVYVDKWMKDKDRQFLSDADLIIVERVLVEESLDRVAYWRKQGKAIVADWDDRYELLQPVDESGNKAAKFWRDGMVDVHYIGGSFTKQLERAPLEQFKHGLSLINGGVTPSRYMSEKWSHICKMWTIPNYLDSDRYLKAKRPHPRNPDNIVIGWGGSLSHKISFQRSGILGALRNVFQKYPNVTFMLCGDKRILEYLPMSRNRIVYQPYVPWYEWPKVVSRFDIGIAPLAGEYDWSRSAIKAEEFSLLGIPFVATNCPTYKDFVDNKCGIFVTDGSEDLNTIAIREKLWQNALEDVIVNYAERKREIDDGLEYSMTWDVARNVDKIVATYEDIINNG